ncbi:MAG: AraC family transcriptional regulator [Spirochaetia bacterium]|nr:AraC family transcriptional regulator [Spirochaetia bacterium]
MRCIIADDEYLVRFSIKDMLEEISSVTDLQTEIIYQAVDGEDLVQAVSEMKPDLVFVDIRMPKVNGLDAIKIGRNISPDTQWVILTGYADFAYAKRAVSLAALDFLLKPASREDVERVVRLAVSRLYEMRSKKQLMLEHRMFGLLQDTFSEDAGISHAEEMPTWFSGIVFVLDTSLQLEDENSLKQDFAELMRTWMNQTPSLNSIAGITLLDDGNLVCAVYANEQSEIFRGIESILQKTDEVLEHSAPFQYARVSLLTRFVCAGSVSSLTALIDKLKLISERAFLRIAEGIGGAISEERLNQLEKEYSEELETLFMLEKVIKNRELEPVKAYQWLHHHQKMLENLYHKSELAAFFWSRSGGNLSRGDEENERNDENAVSMWISWVYEEVNRSKYGKKSTKRRLAVDRALAIIAERYTEEIGLAQVADMLGLTPNYLSTEFNQAMGVTFNQYITGLRMRKAKDLLEDESLTIKEISSRIGYVSSRHFSKVFKKYFGYAPSEHKLLNE